MEILKNSYCFGVINHELLKKIYQVLLLVLEDFANLFIILLLFNSLQGLFKGLKIKDVTELALGANVALSDIKKMRWTTADGNNGEKSICYMKFARQSYYYVLILLCH